MGFIYVFMSLCLIAVISLRISKFRPHWRGNIIMFIAAFFLLAGMIPEPVFASIGGAIITCIVHVVAKKHDKKQSKDGKHAKAPLAAKPQTQPAPKKQYITFTDAADNPLHIMQTATNRQTATNSQTATNPQPKPVPVKQTLTTCVRCGKPLRGPKCKHCAFDHTAEAIFVLCPINPENLQIQIDASN